MKKCSLIEADNGHWYKLADDTSNYVTYLPSVTTILDLFPNKGLDFWRENSTPEQILRAQEDGMIQGSKVHKYAELMIMGKKTSLEGLSGDQISSLGLSDRKLVSYLSQPLTEREEDALKGLETFWEEFKPITVGSEILVWSMDFGGYAGTLDWIGYLWDKKKKKYDLWVVDFKISKSLNRSYDLQLAAYWKAFQDTYKKRIPQARIGILQLGKNKCNYSFKEVKDRKQCLKLFKSIRDIWDDTVKVKQPIIKERQLEFKLNKFKKKGKRLKI